MISHPEGKDKVTDNKVDMGLMVPKEGKVMDNKVDMIHMDLR
jgi:hypothetical protein